MSGNRLAKAGTAGLYPGVWVRSQLYEPRGTLIDAVDVLHAGDRFVFAPTGISSPLDTGSTVTLVSPPVPAAPASLHKAPSSTLVVWLQATDGSFIDLRVPLRQCIALQHSPEATLQHDDSDGAPVVPASSGTTEGHAARIARVKLTKSFGGSGSVSKRISTVPVTAPSASTGADAPLQDDLDVFTWDRVVDYRLPIAADQGSMNLRPSPDSCTFGLLTEESVAPEEDYSEEWIRLVGGPSTKEACTSVHLAREGSDGGYFIAWNGIWALLLDRKHDPDTQTAVLAVSQPGSGFDTWTVEAQSAALDAVEAYVCMIGTNNEATGVTVCVSTDPTLNGLHWEYASPPHERVQRRLNGWKAVVEENEALPVWMRLALDLAV
jgi:hypothetical protein